ncbi:MAG: hypothetical protein LWW93_01430 [Hyphomicrobiales bacterium]|nr:hypothetical protein [Hyphomicrobiales bacterium]
MTHDDAAPRPRSDALRRSRSGRAWLALSIVVAASGWSAAAWEHFVALPRAENTSRVAYALDLVDRFEDTPAHRAYVDLATDMKPWWDAIEGLQHRIQAANDDATRDALIAERDASLVAFVETHALASKVDLLIGSFDAFTRCLVATVCDEAIVERAISIDVKRIWRTFRPWVMHKRTDGDRDRSYGRDLEDLYFRFVG